MKSLDDSCTRVHWQFTTLVLAKVDVLYQQFSPSPQALDLRTVSSVLVSGWGGGDF